MLTTSIRRATAALGPGRRALSATAEAPQNQATAGTAASMGAFWMPFTANQAFKQSPRMLIKSKGMYYWSTDGRKILDGTAGLWCVWLQALREEIEWMGGWTDGRGRRVA